MVALLGRLGEELHDDLGDDGRDALQPLRRRCRLSGDMAVDPFHRIGRAERQTAGEHLIECDAERIKVAARIDRAVHSPGLFGGHIGKRAGDELRRLGRMTLARQTRGDAKPGQPRPIFSMTSCGVGWRSRWRPRRSVPQLRTHVERAPVGDRPLHREVRTNRRDFLCHRIARHFRSLPRQVPRASGPSFPLNKTLGVQPDAPNDTF
jgi:hypothetical protein